ncbi:glycoside hydrolase [Pseudarthrobacter sp. NamE2]|uniref:family 43 glycosylhydrolase n=1 Tax=Pseudarthrobacter sp. NamE2 TaxID=2576838 RepID=UPI0010FDE705|nr:family 43 glycosylhydrolase [Pseudarthrobacter sp. NamE2]TLM83290.1 glycoside hydrolase [Pseudarthrobacter sp. NamE2]
MSQQQVAHQAGAPSEQTPALPPLRADAFTVPYRDPVWDGPTDPILVADHRKGEWVLFYTQRRATEPGLTGVEWVHGTAIGAARSSDGGATWRYQGTVDGLVPPGTELPATLWAPDVVRIGDQWIMYLSVLGGRRTGWTGNASIVQFASPDLDHWEYLGAIDLDSTRVIDAAVARCGDGRYRLWYKDETRDSNTYSAVSGTPQDPASWVVEGVAIPGRPHEGPKVFRMDGTFWMVVDEWRGQGVFRSPDGAGNWTRQEYLDGLILTGPEEVAGRPVVGRHADVVPLAPGDDGRERALLVYFTHPYWGGEDIGTMEPDPRTHLSHVRAAVLKVRDGNLVCTEQ